MHPYILGQIVELALLEGSVKRGSRHVAPSEGQSAATAQVDRSLSHCRMYCGGKHSKGKLKPLNH